MDAEAIEAWEKSERLREVDPVFSDRCRYHLRSNAGRVKVLTLQRRMHPEIAELVSGLFYSDQSWKMPRAKYEESDLKADGVWWIDTSGTKKGRATDRAKIVPAVAAHEGGTLLRDGSWKESNGDSRYHPGEILAIEQLLAEQAAEVHGRETLVLSPYIAQVRHLQRLSSESGRVLVTTVDGCQGIDRDIVIISFVSIEWTPAGALPFALDMRRLNVALSRARQRLYLVGNWARLTNLAQRRDALPHVVGMARFLERSRAQGRVRKS
jgi:superfamily I DNA and/or RNA helicase